MENIVQDTQSLCISVALSPGDNSQNFRGPYSPNSCKNCHKRKLKCERIAIEDPCKHCMKKNKTCEIRPKKKPGPKPKKNKNHPRYSQDRYSSHSSKETGKMLSNTSDLDLLSPQQLRNGIRRASFNGYNQGWDDNMYRTRRNSDGGFTNNEAYSDSFPPMFNDGFPFYVPKTPLWTNTVTTNETLYVPNNTLGHTPTISGYSPEISPTISGYSPEISPTIFGYSPEISPAISGYSPEISPAISGYSPDISPVIRESTPGNHLANTPLIIISSPYDCSMYSPLASSPAEFYGESYDEGNYIDGERNCMDGERNKEMDYIDGLGILRCEHE